MPFEWHTRRLTFCGAALVAMLIAVPALAQPSFDYDRLVDAYATGHLNEAVSQLSRWPSEQVKGAVGLFVKAIEAQTALVTAPVSSRRLRAAVMLHTDLAAALFYHDFSRAESHVNLARRLVDLLAGRRRRDPRAREFVPRWYEFAPSMYLAHQSPDKALQLVQDGFTHAPDNPTLHLYSGIVFEMIGPKEAALVARSRLLTLRPGRMDAPLEAAARAYGLALKADSHMAVARIILAESISCSTIRERAPISNRRSQTPPMSARGIWRMCFLAISPRATSARPTRCTSTKRRWRSEHSIRRLDAAAARMADALGEFERAREIALALVGIEKHEDPVVELQAWRTEHAGPPMAADVGAGTVIRTAALLSIIGCGAVIGRAQERPLFRVGVEVVELDVSVTRGGQAIAGLTARDFALTDNGVAQQIDSVTLDALPLERAAGARHQRERCRRTVAAPHGCGRRAAPRTAARRSRGTLTFSHRSIWPSR